MASTTTTISGKAVNPIGYGLISLMHPGRVSPADAIKTLKAALNAGSNFWNASDYYGTPEYNSLHLLNAYFTQYPEDADKVVVSVKSCIDVRNGIPHCDPESVRQNVEKCLAILDGKCRLDVFAPGRLDPDGSVEETVAAIQEFVDAGKIGGVGLSECIGASLRKASKVAKIQTVEVELSLFENRGIYENGVADACREFGIPIVAYSPIGRGFLTGQYRKFEDLGETDYRKMFPRFAKEHFDNNMQILHAAEEVAKKKGCSTVQVALAWVVAQRGVVGAPVIPIPGTASEERLKENTAVVQLGEEDLEELKAALEKVEVQGARYSEKHARLLNI
ncbi:hypothetical protein M409DRAFT_59810 [Zasmidium cellare ATCC 36951]|uniref:NADP-dependent oxidoreductase domain-containing protein n=1 Tax=Zasmidium cellare ATCC 36951 TaxID=1080233 RepID=A0A6A6C103_ZASCE|nr:uncharacterized protein M409DRAFT_59810 [Zasmidium cellare ATCC 36951]KAF2160543.1 hypothetical protein M409DRAFT_59810 [Zasmidium cellare ATCC 36951]